MGIKHGFLGVLTAVTAALLTATPTVSGYAGQANAFAVVVAKGSPIDDLSIHDLKHLYMGDLINGPGGKRLVPLALPTNSADRMAFDKAVLGMSAEQAARFWVDRKIRGQSGAPKSLDSADLVQRVVSKLDGGIGYVPIGQVTKDVKIVRVDGKAPGDGGYRVVF
jgi:hypothetical protein